LGVEVVAKASQHGDGRRKNSRVVNDLMPVPEDATGSSVKRYGGPTGRSEIQLDLEARG
jgi:hypothetical protein